MLLPRALQFRDEALSLPLGAAKVKPVAVKVDPVSAFERDDHNHVPAPTVPFFGFHLIDEADCRQIKGAAQPSATHEVRSAVPPQPTPVAAPPSTEKPTKFKVGALYVVPEEGTDWYRKFFTDGWGFAHLTHEAASLEDRAFIRYAKSPDLAAQIDAAARELVSPSEPKEADGWVPAIAMLCPDAKAGEWEAKRFDGSIVSADRIRMSLREWAERLAAKGLEGHFRLVKQQ